MKNKKLYFENEDATLCMILEAFIEDAKYDGRKEITLIEAIPDNSTTDMIFCSLAGEVCERSEMFKINGYHFSKEELDAAEKLDVKLIGIRNGVKCYLPNLFA